MAGHHAMGAFAPYRQGGGLDMPHSHLQDRFVRAVVDGQGDIDGGNLDISHNSVAGNVEHGAVFLLLFIREVIPAALMP